MPAPIKLIRITTVPMALKYLLPGQMRYMAQQGMQVVMISADGEERADVINTEQCPHIIVPFTRQITPIKDLACLWQLIKIFKKQQPDIVHTHTPKAGLLGMLAAKICGIPVRIHTVAGLPLMVQTGLKLQILKAVEKITYAAATQVWPNSQSLLTYIKDNKYGKPEKLNIISKGSSNGINLQRFSKHALTDDILAEVKKSINYNPNNYYLLSIGRLVADKGIVELVLGFKDLLLQYPNLKLILVGKYETSLDPLPNDIINEIKLNSCIIHIQWSAYVEYYLALANLFVFPSHREGFPNVLLQSAAMYTPIICSAITGNVDIVTHNTTGLLFEKANIEAMKNNIIFAINNPDSMHKMAVHLQVTIHSYYDNKIIWQAIWQQYQQLLTKH